MTDKMDYASSGVDIDLELSGCFTNFITRKICRNPELLVRLNSWRFGGLIEFGEHLLALATDGVGSKLQIASKLNQWSGVGIDCMAMNVNDLLCVGAEPIAFVDMLLSQTRR